MVPTCGDPAVMDNASVLQRVMIRVLRAPLYSSHTVNRVPPPDAKLCV